MSLNSFSFLAFFSLLLLALFICGKIGQRLQIACILCFSYLFIYRYDWRFSVCIFIYTILMYLFGQMMDGTYSVKKRRILLWGGGIASVLMLCYFKYADFFVQSICRVFGEKNIALHIMLPIGISFYVFSGLSYLIDIYWRRYHAEKNLLDFALYIALFSKLTAGPIVRAEEFLPQVKSYRGLRLDKFSEGIQIFVFGLFKKIVLADHLCVFVDDVFSAPAAFDTFTTILAVISYSFQIYFDFSGYSDMAIGISKAIGFDFPPNFNLPYLAGNSSEFWKRWHISLSSWFQEYLYIPLGGSRKGEARTYFNLLTVMLVSGFWHGAGWTFIFWGFLHGITNCVFRFFSKKYKIKFECMPLNFLVATIFWVAFRADCIDTAFAVWKGMFTLHSGITQIYSWTFFAGFCLLFSSVAAIISSKKKCLKMVNGFYPIMDLSKLSSLILFFTFIGLTVIMGYFGNNAFIYGKF